MLETIGAAVMHWIVGEALDKGRLEVGRDPLVRELDRIVREAVAPAVAVATSDPETRDSLSAAMTERLAARLDLTPGALRDPATCMRRWLAPFDEPIIDGVSYWQHSGVDRELVIDAIATEVVRGIASNARRGGALEPLANEQRFDAVLGKLNKIEHQLASLTVMRTSPAFRQNRPMMGPAHWGRYVSRPLVEADIAGRVLRGKVSDRSPMLLVWGTGGFGKTFLAQNLCLSRPVLDRFVGGVLWVQLNEDRSLVRVVHELQSLVRMLDGQEGRSGDPHQLVRRVAEMLEDMPTLLIIDDAWTEGHVEPFVDSLPPTCFSVVTSRNQWATPPDVPRLHVDLMRPEESVQLLRGGLRISDEQLDPLRTICGDWPLILALVGGQLQWVVDQGATIGEAIAYVRSRLGEHGLTAFDQQRAGGPRNRTVAATMETSLTFLEERQPGAAARYFELAAFQDDSDVPRQLISALWHRRAGLDRASSESLLLEFANLSLVQHFQVNPPMVRLHDVVRSYLRDRAGPDLIADISRDILDLNLDQDEDDDDEQLW